MKNCRACSKELQDNEAFIPTFNEESKSWQIDTLSNDELAFCSTCIEIMHPQIPDGRRMYKGSPFLLKESQKPAFDKICQDNGMISDGIVVKDEDFEQVLTSLESQQVMLNIIQEDENTTPEV